MSDGRRGPTGAGRLVVGLCQLAVSGKDENLDVIGRQSAVAASQGARLIVFPEAAMCGFRPPGEPVIDLAEPLDGPFVSRIAGLARGHRVTVVAGMFERTSDPVRAANTLVVLGPDGGLQGAYRKMHLFDALGQRESTAFLPGPATPMTVEVEGMQVGLMTCYDLRFPELARALAASGAELIVVPAAWYSGPQKAEQWTVLLRARAIENTAWVAGCGQALNGFTGRSMLVDPMGVVAAGMGEEPGVLVADVDAERLRDVRSSLPSLRHRRLGVAGPAAPDRESERPGA